MSSLDVGEAPRGEAQDWQVQRRQQWGKQRGGTACSAACTSSRRCVAQQAKEKKLGEMHAKPSYMPCCAPLASPNPFAPLSQEECEACETTEERGASPPPVTRPTPRRPTDGLRQCWWGVVPSMRLPRPPAEPPPPPPPHPPRPTPPPPAPRTWIQRARNALGRALPRMRIRLRRSPPPPGAPPSGGVPTPPRRQLRGWVGTLWKSGRPSLPMDASATPNPASRSAVTLTPCMQP